MNWILACIIMFLSSVVLYLFVRKSNQLNVPQQLINLVMFFVPGVIYLVLCFGERVEFRISTFEFLLIVIQGFFFSYLGNVFSLKGMKYAPNPGYSLIISKSYVVFTSVASIFLFQATLTLKSVLAIMLIIIFSAVISVEKKKQQDNKDIKWLLYTIGAFFCWGLLALSSKFLLNLGVPVLIRLLYSMIIVSTLILGEIKIKKVPLKGVSLKQMLVLLMIGIFASSFNYFMQIGFQLAPNVGYVNATNAGSISLLTIASALLFKDELTLKKLIGVAGVTVGLILLFI